MALTLRELEIFKGSALLLSLDVTVDEGEILTVMGPSGSGKSTLLQAIAGHLDTPFSFSGSISIDGTNLASQPPHRRGVGVMFQDALLFEHMTVEQNIMFAMPSAKYQTKSRKREAVAKLLHAVELDEMQHRVVTTLSGGQQSRISLLRTLAAEPQAVLLDEPFSKLDTALRQHIREWTFTQLRERNIPALLVTHDSADAVSAGGQAIELSSC
ncbi:ATP-binding cassette domain-containing protein [Alteromonas genovensis]|uniref:ATP-binding cassette domain-containing protein n=1 Tax=Alteromonas genovensis TaxID=471225 RepID=A0A6N9TP93_9ALTE|nr:ATP-binding cassette domain-containing protein [Alteromonas genovensis]NDW16478.1 ATP-binding cassette domain-containing protein [Alteromonas genovensis]